MRTKKFFYNSVTTAFYQVIVMIAGFITPQIMLRYYGSEINGLVSSITQFIAYFNLVEAGLSGAAIYALYKPLADSDNHKINAIVSAAKRFYNKSGYMFLSLTIGLAVFYPLYVKTDVITPISMGILVVVLGTNGVLEFFTLAKYRVLLSADQKTYVISLASLVHIVINTLIIVVLGTIQVHIVALRFAALLSIFTRTFILMVYTNRNYKFLDYTVDPDYSSLDKRWDALYLQVLGMIHQGSPIVIITLILKDLKLVSVYVVFNMVIAGINGILSVFINGLSASFGDVIARQETSVLQKAYSEFEYVYYGLITTVYAAAFVTIMPFIRVYTRGIKDINYDLPVIGFLFVLNGLLYSLKTPQGMLVISAGLFKETKVQTTIQGAIAVIVGILLAPTLGIAGVLIGSILSNIYRDIDLLFYIPKNVTKLSYKKSLKRFLRIGISIIVIWIPFLFIQVDPTGYIDWAIHAILISMYSVFIVFLTNFISEREMMHNVLIRGLNIFKK